MNNLTIKILTLIAMLLGFGLDSLARDNKAADEKYPFSVRTIVYSYSFLSAEDLETSIPFINTLHKKRTIFELKPEMCYLLRGYEDLEDDNVAHLRISCSQDFLKDYDVPDISDKQLANLSAKIQKLIKKYPDKELSKAFADYWKSGGIVQFDVEVMTLKSFEYNTLCCRTDVSGKNNFAFQVGPKFKSRKSEIYDGPFKEMIDPCFLSSDKIVRGKPALTIGTIGPVFSGKTTLTSSISVIMSELGLANCYYSNNLDHAPDEMSYGMTRDIDFIEYETPNRYYRHIDCPGYPEYVDNTITALARLDGAIFVISASDKITPSSFEHIRLARQQNVPALVVFINKCDMVDDPQIIERVEKEVREALSQYGYDGRNTPVIKGSALGAANYFPEDMEKVKALIDAVDTWIPLPEGYEKEIADYQRNAPQADWVIYGPPGRDEDIETNIPFRNILHKIGIVELQPGMCYLVGSYEDERKGALQLKFSCSEEFLKGYYLPDPSNRHLFNMTNKIMDLIDKYPDKRLSESLENYRRSGGLIQFNLERVTVNNFEDGALCVGLYKNSSSAFLLFPRGTLHKTKFYHVPVNEVMDSFDFDPNELWLLPQSPPKIYFNPNE